MAKSRSVQLSEAMNEKRLVRFTRPFEPGHCSGYVLDVGKKFFLLAVVDERIRFDGYKCLRINDIRRLREDPQERFIVAALHARKERIRRRPRVNLGSVSEILWSVNNLSPLVTIHRQKIEPEACWIGKIVDVDDSEVSMLEIDPDANWDKAPTQYRLKEITEIGFGGGYEEALFLVGGNPR